MRYDGERIRKTGVRGECMDAVAAGHPRIEAQSPAATPVMPDARPIVAGLVRTLARFRSWKFTEQRAMLKRIVRSFQVIDGAIPEITLSGAFLRELAHTTAHNHF